MLSVCGGWSWSVAFASRLPATTFFGPDDGGETDPYSSSVLPTALVDSLPSTGGWRTAFVPSVKYFSTLRVGRAVSFPREQRLTDRIGRFVAVDGGVVRVADRDRERLLEAEVGAAWIVDADADRVRVLHLVVETDRALQLRARDLEAARVAEGSRAAGRQERERVGLAAVRIADLREVADQAAARLVLVDVVVVERDVGRRLVHVRDRDRELLVEGERAAGRQERERVGLAAVRIADLHVH